MWHHRSTLSYSLPTPFLPLSTQFCPPFSALPSPVGALVSIAGSELYCFLCLGKSWIWLCCQSVWNSLDSSRPVVQNGIFLWKKKSSKSEMHLNQSIKVNDHLVWSRKIFFLAVLLHLFLLVRYLKGTYLRSWLQTFQFLDKNRRKYLLNF